MKPAPYPNKDEFDTAEDRTVADPLADDTLNLWNQTARKNRDIFTEIFRPVPTNLVRDWKAYEVSDFSVTAFVILDPPPSR
jgi:phospholipase D1/2